MKLSQYHVVTQPFFDEIEERSKRVVFATRTSSVRVIDEVSWKMLESGNFDNLPKETLFELVDIELLVPANEDDLTTILNRNDAAILDDDILFFSIQPTAMCQLGCHYCGQEHKNKLLSDEYQQLLIQRVRAKLEAKKVSKLAITWFGAEPLIGLPAIRTLTPELKSLAENFGCEYESKIVTNGLVLTEKLATELVKDLNVNCFEITLDGVAEFHDVRRMQKNGMPTFDKIFANTIALAHRQDIDPKIIIRCNVDRQNYESVSSLLLMLASEGVQERIEFYVAPVHSWGNDAHTRSLSPEEFATWEIKWFTQMLQLGFPVGFIPARKPVVCMAVKPQSELVDAYGTVFNCTEVSYVPAYGTPNEYAIEHLSGKPMPGKRERLGNFNDRVRQGEYPCSSCRMLPVCGGACPKAWQEGLEPCPSAKRNIEQRLLLSYAVSRIEEQMNSSVDAEEVTLVNA
ncbi:radical SAM/SPASM domain-containing protein [Tolypothrix sp. NIES-4075]|uniref:radical SAM/SPASM domain-containing protein n=1 Tax=Tolypothrix sp. NIES-4075 TaxID=2005459 RepID=UPI000B5CD37B|nr:radical SAM protein [Tolypothrix sp. NIES-4075]